MARYGRASVWSRGGYVNLSSMPSPKEEHTITFAALTGGLNISAPDYQLDTTESPDLLNMLWKNGALCSRFGQDWVYNTSHGVGYTAYQGLFWDNAFFHIGSSIYYGEPDAHGMELTELCTLSAMYSDYVPARGTFFRYQDYLMYKAPGVFVRIEYRNGSFTAYDVVAEAYTPITYIGCDWQTGAGISYQPENRLSPKKTVWFNAGTSEEVAFDTGDGETTDYEITAADFVYVTDITINGATYGNFTVSGNVVSFYTAPAAGAEIKFTYRVAVKTYKLPVAPDEIVSVLVDGAERSDWSLTGDVITFVSAPHVAVPAEANTVRVTYTKDNTDALHSIMDCPYAIVYGGNTNLCIVVGGCPAQPNAFFWNGNNIVMDPSYWPMEHYNFAGDTEEAITGFGKQTSYLVVFKTRGVGKVSMSTTEIDNGANNVTNRVYISMNYVTINPIVGCDLPWSIQLIDDYLVFANTSQGVHYITYTSEASENNIICISEKINGDVGRRGLLARLRDAKSVTSFDDDKRYWLLMDGYVYVWDYSISKRTDPSWFPQNGINAVSMFRVGEHIYHLDWDGRVTVFDRSFADYGEPYHRRYQFATQFFSTYDRLKTVTRAEFSLRGETDSVINLTYRTDYERRIDLTPLVLRSWHMSPRNMRWRNMAVYPFSAVKIRKPGCIHVRHFTMILTCDEPGCDMPIIFAQVLYKYEGRDR